MDNNIHKDRRPHMVDKVQSIIRAGNHNGKFMINNREERNYSKTVALLREMLDTGKGSCGQRRGRPASKSSLTSCPPEPP